MDASHFYLLLLQMNSVSVDVLPRMNEASYDLVLIDADASSIAVYLEHALRLVRPGGAVLVPHALWRDSVADPARRDGVTAELRGLLAELSESPAVHVALSPVGDGLLQIVTGRLHGALADPAQASAAYAGLFGFYAVLVALGLVIYLWSRDSLK